jgi:hypothetical protein
MRVRAERFSVIEPSERMKGCARAVPTERHGTTRGRGDRPRLFQLKRDAESSHTKLCT